VYVVCKGCEAKIPVAGRPSGSTSLDGVSVDGPVSVEGSEVRFGPGGSISFGRGGSLGFGPPKPSRFVCRACGHSAEYRTDEILDD